MGLSINNVSMDYFLRGVDAAKPSSSAKASPSAKATEDKPVDTTAENTGKLVTQLDVLLMKAAKASTKGLDGNYCVVDCPSYYKRDYLDRMFK